MRTTVNNINEQLQNPKNWRRTHKKQYDIYMCRPLPGTQCTNRLEGSQYVTDQNKQFILSGTVGETWVIDVNKLAKTYTFADGTPITPNTLKAKCEDDGQIEWVKISTRADATPNWAFHLPKSIQNFPVQTSWGDTLYANRPGVEHLKGDFLVCADAGGQPNLNDVWVVNGEIFPRTYDLHAFPNMYNTNEMQSETTLPKKVFTTKNNGSTDIAIIRTVLKDIRVKGQPFLHDTITTKLIPFKNEHSGAKVVGFIEAGNVLEIHIHFSNNNQVSIWSRNAGEKFISRNYIDNIEERKQIVEWAVSELNNKSNNQADPEKVKKNAYKAYKILSTLENFGINVPEPVLRLDGDTPDAFIDLGEQDDSKDIVMIYDNSIEFIYFDKDIESLEYNDIDNKDAWKKALKAIASEYMLRENEKEQRAKRLMDIRDYLSNYMSEHPIMYSHIDELKIPELWINKNFDYNKGFFTCNEKDIAYGIYVKPKGENINYAGIPVAYVYVAYMLDSMTSNISFRYGHGGYSVSIVEDPTQEDYRKAFERCENAYYSAH